MAEQEKKPEMTLDEDAMRKAMHSWRTRARDMDFDESETPLKAEIVEEIHRRSGHG